MVESSLSMRKVTRSILVTSIPLHSIPLHSNGIKKLWKTQVQIAQLGERTIEGRDVRSSNLRLDTVEQP